MLGEQLLQRYVAIASEPSLSRAARALHLPPTTLSRSLDEIEADVGVTLIRRSANGIEMTEAGRSFLVEAHASLLQMTRARDLARRASRRDAPVLRICHVPGLSYALLPKALCAVHQIYPSLRTFLSETASAHSATRLKDGSADIALLRPPVLDDRLVEEQLSNEHLVIALPSDHPLAVHSEIAASQLQDLPLIGFPRHDSPSSYDRWTTILRQGGFEPDLAVDQADHLASVLIQVEAGLGAALVPEVGALRFRSDKIAIRSLTGDPANVPLGMAWRAHDPSPHLRDFVAALRESSLAVTVR